MFQPRTVSENDIITKPQEEGKDARTSIRSGRCFLSPARCLLLRYQQAQQITSITSRTTSRSTTTAQNGYSLVIGACLRSTSQHTRADLYFFRRCPNPVGRHKGQRLSYDFAAAQTCAESVAHHCKAMNLSGQRGHIAKTGTH